MQYLLAAAAEEAAAGRLKLFFSYLAHVQPLKIPSSFSFLICRLFRVFMRFVLPRHLANWFFLVQHPTTHPPLDSRSHRGSSVASLSARFHTTLLLLILRVDLAIMSNTYQLEVRLGRPLATLSISIGTVRHSSASAFSGTPMDQWCNLGVGVSNVVFKCL